MTLLGLALRLAALSAMGRVAWWLLTDDDCSEQRGRAEVLPPAGRLKRRPRPVRRRRLRVFRAGRHPF